MDAVVVLVLLVLSHVLLGLLLIRDMLGCAVADRLLASHCTFACPHNHLACLMHQELTCLLCSCAVSHRCGGCLALLKTLRPGCIIS